MSVRRAGLQNDLAHLAQLPPYPLERIAAPTRIVHGRAEAVVPFAQAEFAAGAIPNARLLPIDRRGHLIWIGEAADRTLAAVVEFLRAAGPRQT